jgi:hypothetical protein
MLYGFDNTPGTPCKRDQGLGHAGIVVETNKDMNER